MNRQVKYSALATVMLGASGLLIAFITARAATPASARSQGPGISQNETGGTKISNFVSGQKMATDSSQLSINTVVAKNNSPTASSPGVLDERRQFALGMIETGNHDGEIGGAGEVSRYQIMPAVWRRYSDSRNYHDPGVSLEVAREHWIALYTMFKRRAGREPTDFDMYVLWNTSSGYYSSRDFDPSRLGPVVRDRAQRYVNLVQWGQNS
jgi:hypothetical protein